MVSSIKKIQNAHFKVWDFLNSSSSRFSFFSSKSIIKTITYLTLIYALNIYSTTQAFGTNYHIAVNGKSSGDGSKGNPWDIVTGLSGSKGSPGDTLWLHGGVYKGPFTSRVAGSSSANIVVAQFPGEVAIIDGINGGSKSITLDIKGRYGTYYGFTVMNSSSKRYSSQSGGAPTDIKTNTGIHVDGANNKLINLIVRDNVGGGIGFWNAATNSELYGNIIYNNGWKGADRGHGHGIYAQNTTTVKQIRDNVVFGGFGSGIHIYGVNGGTTGFHIEGNSLFNNGVLSVGTTAIIIGGESAADNITIKNNNTYKDASSNASKGRNVQVHYGNTINGTLRVENNNFIGGELVLSIKNWKRITFTGNNVLGHKKVLDFGVPSGALSAYSWNNNNYTSSNSSNSMNNATFEIWKRSFGLDGSSRFSSSAPNNQIIVRPNSYVKGTGSVIVYNHQRLSSVDVDISKIVSNGMEYEILDVENYTGQAVITGKYSGGTVRLPMNLNTTVKPSGVSSVPHSDQGFGVFIVRSKGKATSSAVVTTNKQPTLNAISNPSAINEGAAEQTVNLSGITSGEGESQKLTITASSDNPTLIPNPSVQYTSPNTNGSVKFKPAANRFGKAKITVTVNDGASTNNTISRTFEVTVNPINDAPTLNELKNVTVAGNSGTQTINLGGITAGSFENQTLSITATSSNTGLIPNPTVIYTSPNNTGSIKFAPVANKSGSATITVKVTDNGPGTSPQVNTFTRTFTVTVGAVVAAANKQPTLNTINNPTAINERAPEQTINLTGISAGEGETQKLTITASSDNTALIPNPSVQYTSPNDKGTLKFKPAANRFGKAKITVTLNDGASTNNAISRTFEVTVNPVNDAPTLNSISNVTVEGNSSEKTISLAGISAGPFEDQGLSITATSSNTGLIPNPSVSYSSPNKTGSLKFKPVGNKSGTATITVKVTDNGPGTSPHVNTFTRQFTVTVGAISNINTNSDLAPTINNISDFNEVLENSNQQSVSLSGITAGSGDNKSLKVTATSSNTSIIPNPIVDYSAPNNKGTLKFKPASSKTGTVTIQIKVQNGNAKNNVTTKSFKIKVNPINKIPTLDALADLKIAVNSNTKTVNLKGISAGKGDSQQLTVKVSSSNTSLIPTPDVKYNSPQNSGTIQFKPISNKTGSSVITVQVTDNGPENAPHKNKFSRSFKVTVEGVATNKPAEEEKENNVSKVTKLNLINTVNNSVILELKDGMTIYTSKIPVKLSQLNIDAVINPDFKGSVIFGFDDKQKYKVENERPYAIGGDEPRGYYKWGGLTPGFHTITATSYSKVRGEGDKGTTLKVTVNVVDDYSKIGSPFGDIISLHLINALNNNIIFELKDGMTIDVNELPMALDQLNIRGVSSTNNTGSVIFGFNGNSRYNIENISPFVIGRNSGTDYFKWGNGLKMGVNSVIATTYSERNGRGKAGIPYQISFTIVDSKALSTSSKIKTLTGMNEPDHFKVQLTRFYPNPVQDQLSVQLTAPETETSQIYINDINGQLIKTYTSEIVKGENELMLDTSELKSGVYIVTISSVTNKINFKVIKN